MKNILALIGGGDRDEIILQTAYAAAMPLNAHINCLHIHVSAGITLYNEKHPQFAMGAGIDKVLRDLETRAVKYSAIASDHARKFFSTLEVNRETDGNEPAGVTVSFREESDVPIENLIREAGNNDLIVMGRARQTQGLSQDTLERLIRRSGRPILVAARSAPQTRFGTIMVCYKDLACLDRLVSTTRPFFVDAGHIIFLHVHTRKNSKAKVSDDFKDRFRSIELVPEVRIVHETRVPDALAAAAYDCGVDLVVMGAYGRSRIVELIFGSITESVLVGLDKPIMLVH
jgi:nucleotide-binding universal stress UspA family protein